MSHANKKRPPGPSKPRLKPTAADVRAVREAAGLTQEQAAALIFVAPGYFLNWEADDKPSISAGSYVLLCALSRQYTELDATHWRLHNGAVIEVLPKLAPKKPVR